MSRTYRYKYFQERRRVDRLEDEFRKIRREKNEKLIFSAFSYNSSKR